jgi:hypothetical protein
MLIEAYRDQYTLASGSSFARSTVSGLFQLLLFLVVSLPTGSMLGVNIKIVVFGIFLAAFVPYLLVAREGFSSGDAAFLIAVVAFFCLWALIGIVGGGVDGNQVLHKLRDMVSTVVIAWLSIFSIRRGLVSAERLATIVIYGALSISVMKLAITVGSFYFGANPVEATLSIFPGAPIISGPIPFGLLRMEFTPDLLGSFALFALLTPRLSGVRFGKPMTFLITLVVLASAVMAFSRYIWFAHLMAILVAMVVQRNWRLLIVIAVAAIVIGGIFPDFFSVAFESRFLSTSAEKSDAARIEQSRALIEEFEDRPILGKGMGAHAAGLLRDDRDEHLYVYELEWLAFLMQFGIVGMMGIILLIGLSCRDLIMSKHPAAVYLWLMFFVWLCSAFTNPYLTSSYAGGAFGLFMAIFYRVRHVSEGGVRFRSGVALEAIA